MFRYFLSIAKQKTIIVFNYILSLAFLYNVTNRYKKISLLKAKSIRYKKKEQKLLQSIDENYDKILGKIKKNKKDSKIKALFLVTSESIWQYDEIFNIMLKSDFWEPVIHIYPHLNYIVDIDVSMNQVFNYFKKKNYKVYSFNKKDYKKNLAEISPDIVFFTLPYDSQFKEFNISYWYKLSLTCYVPYAFVSADLYESNYNLIFHNIMWKCFYETNIHKYIAEIYADNGAKNVVVSGYPSLDLFLKNNETKKNNCKKVIIWAPHHSIEYYENRMINEPLRYSDFLLYNDFFWELIDKYKKEVYFIFKPHPALKKKLYNLKDWGKNRTDEYFKKWNSFENTEINDSTYDNLFLNSDAMISTSGSFTAEYLSLNKPCLFNFINTDVENDFNIFGKMAIDCWSKSYSRQDIINFIEDIISNTDKLKEKRSEFIESYLKPKHGNASRYIVSYLEKIFTGDI